MIKLHSYILNSDLFKSETLTGRGGYNPYFPSFLGKQEIADAFVKSIKNREERRNRYLLPLKCLFCYAEKSGLKDIMKMEKAQEQEYSLMLKREYGNPCSSPKKFILFCRKLLFLESKNINWEANVWFTERLNISSERYSRSNAVESFSFLDIHFEFVK